MEIDFFTPQWIGLALSLPVIYAAWHEYAANNLRDAKLMVSVGVGGVLLSTAGFAL